eukprot:Nk52_evm9s1810 gene=Nk52_evmTU9s1810
MSVGGLECARTPTPLQPLYSPSDCSCANQQQMCSTSTARSRQTRANGMRGLCGGERGTLPVCGSGQIATTKGAARVNGALVYSKVDTDAIREADVMANREFGEHNLSQDLMHTEKFLFNRDVISIALLGSKGTGKSAMVKHFCAGSESFEISTADSFELMSVRLGEVISFPVSSSLALMRLQFLILDVDKFGQDYCNVERILRDVQGICVAFNPQSSSSLQIADSWSSPICFRYASSTPCFLICTHTITSLGSGGSVKLSNHELGEYINAFAYADWGCASSSSGDGVCNLFEKIVRCTVKSNQSRKDKNPVCWEKCGPGNEIYCMKDLRMKAKAFYVQIEKELHKLLLTVNSKDLTKKLQSLDEKVNEEIKRLDTSDWGESKSKIFSDSVLRQMYKNMYDEIGKWKQVLRSMNILCKLHTTSTLHTIS